MTLLAGIEHLVRQWLEGLPRTEILVHNIWHLLHIAWIEEFGFGKILHRFETIFSIVDICVTGPPDVSQLYTQNGYTQNNEQTVEKDDSFDIEHECHLNTLRLLCSEKGLRCGGTWRTCPRAHEWGDFSTIPNQAQTWRYPNFPNISLISSMGTTSFVAVHIVEEPAGLIWFPHYRGRNYILTRL